MNDITKCTKNKWAFWIDVGGTFTDCIAHSPSGEMYRCKVLSSGAVKGKVKIGSTQDQLMASTIPNSCPEFFRDYTLQLFNPDGERIAERKVKSYDHENGIFMLDRPLPPHIFSKQDALPYQLVSGEEAPLLAIRQLMNLTLSDPIHNIQIRLGTTVGTNT